MAESERKLSLEPLYQVESAFSLLSYLFLLVLFVYILLKVKKPSPSVALAMATTKIVVLQRFRNVVLLVFLGFFDLFAAFFAKYFVGNVLLHKLLEISALFLFLLAGTLWAREEILKGKTETSVEK